VSHAIRLKPPFSWLSLTQQFLLLTAAILLVGMVVIGNWLGRQIEASALNQAISMAAVYVESILAAKARLVDPST